MSDITVALKGDYSQKLETLTFSNKIRLYNLYEEPKHSHAAARILAFNVIMAASVLAFTISAAAIGSEIYHIIGEKTKNANISSEKVSEIISRSEMWNSPEEFENSEQRHFDDMSDIQVNEYGETYGTISLGTDLCAVFGYENGEKITGYCYFDDLNQLLAIDSTNTTIPIRNWIYVYDSDTTKIIGKFVLNSEDSEFKTTEQLKDPAVQASLSDGYDFEEYESISQSRMKQNIDKVNETDLNS